MKATKNEREKKSNFLVFCVSRFLPARWWTGEHSLLFSPLSLLTAHYTGGDLSNLRKITRLHTISYQMHEDLEGVSAVPRVVQQLRDGATHQSFLVCKCTVATNQNKPCPIGWVGKLFGSLDNLHGLAEGLTS